MDCPTVFGGRAEPLETGCNPTEIATIPGYPEHLGRHQDIALSEL
jgi:hypothetical protein